MVRIFGLGTERIAADFPATNRQQTRRIMLSRRCNWHFGALAITAAFLVQPAGASTDFDGRWAVEVIPGRGACDGPYFLPIEVAESRVTYIGKAQMEAQGGIDADGRVRVSFISGPDRLDAKGTMSNPRFGVGSWKSPTENCDGTWIARKG